MHILKLDHLASMIAAPLIWAAHFLICYVLVSLACTLGWSEQQLLGRNPAEIGIALISLAALALLGYTAILNFEKYRQAPSDASSANDISAFIALNSVLLCALSTVALIWVAFPTLMLPSCAT